MRLFTAVTFTDETKSILAGWIKILRDNTVRGSFPRLENLHLTLVFIGETPNPDAAKQVLDRVRAAPFTLEIGGIGSFGRRDGNICWTGVRKSSTLELIQHQLSKDLRDAGFTVDNRQYTPHITLGRSVRFTEKFDPVGFADLISPLCVTVSKVSLMKSARVNGTLTYSEIYAKALTDQ